MCSPNAPDMTAQNTAAASQAATAATQSAMSAEQLAWAKEMYAESAPDRQFAREQATKVSSAQLGAMATQTALAKDYDEYNKRTFRPLEQGIVADAAGYDTTARRETMAGQAIADVGTQADASRETMAREAMARGVDPSSGNFAAAQGAFGVREAAAKAAAGNTARTQVETVGAARKMDAANLGRNLASNQATSAGIALSAGNNSSANGQAPLSAVQSGATLMNQGFGGAQAGLSGAQAGYAGAAGTLGNINNTMVKAGESNSAMWGALGQVGGALATKLPMFAVSDVNVKEDITPVDTEKALEAIKQTPVSNWAYREGVIPGEDGQKHVGPMAQDVQKNMGNKVAPGGKKIDLVALNGVVMAGLQGLSRKVDKVIAAQGVTI